MSGNPSDRIPVALMVGTRPEAIKMAPVHRALAASDSLRPVLISSGQHRELLDGAFDALELRPDHALDVMTEGQTSADVLSRVVERTTQLLSAPRPAALLVQGDTTTVLGAALAAFYERIPIGHVEAGLRTYDFEHPFPEEANRQLVDRISRWCFAPTAGAKANLLAERIDEARVHVTGNTAVDSILWARGRSDFTCSPDTLLVTLHRQESFGEPLREIVAGIHDFLSREPAARVLWPVHPNPHVREVQRDFDDAAGRFETVEPMDYLAFAGALASCRLVLSDSGGIQEEAPSLGKRVLVARERTERPEALDSAINRLVERDRDAVCRALEEAWAQAPYEGSLPAANPFGDGRAGEEIVTILEAALGG
ncbi:MAG: UDP-N-acetylglucosamine 2-epimerase (non-hydrolyzing) [Myxococcota bacterium]|jgi:UDP-N-acetylglucosamine 2-epimerase (non-hydrolysing)|nr:UDP-N-acetylglucosamine 2-epimerase (non-hydrolyzing) [Myxococcota bacterium]